MVRSFEEIDTGTQLDDIKVFGTDYFKKSLFVREKEPEKVEYSSDSIPFGRRISDGSVYYIDLSQACRILGIGATRSGKTFMLRSFCDRLVASGYWDVVYLTDIKNEFYSSLKPVQPDLRKNLLNGEVPSPTRVVSFRPTFFKDFDYNFLPDDNFWFSFDARKIDKGDFMSLIKISSMKPNQQIAVPDIYEEFRRRLDADPELDVGYYLFEDIIDNCLRDQTEQQKYFLKQKFKPFHNTSFFEKKYHRDVVDLMSRNRGYVPCFNYEGWDDELSDSSPFDYPVVTLNAVLRDLIKARRKVPSPIKPLWIMLDEASRFISNSKTNSFKKTILESNDRDTRYNVNYFILTQFIKDVPEKIFSQARYLLIPYNADVESVKYLINNTGVASSVQRAPRQATDIVNRLKRVKHSWAIIDRNKPAPHNIDLIKPIAPLSFHIDTNK